MRVRAPSVRVKTQSMFCPICRGKGSQLPGEKVRGLEASNRDNYRRGGFTSPNSSVVSHLDWPMMASTVLKVVHLGTIVSNQHNVGRPCTRSCVTGVSKWTLIVLGIWWRNVLTLLLSEVALIDSMLVIVIVFSFSGTVSI